MLNIRLVNRLPIDKNYAIFPLDRISANRNYTFHEEHAVLKKNYHVPPLGSPATVEVTVNDNVFSPGNSLFHRTTGNTEGPESCSASCAAPKHLGTDQCQGYESQEPPLGQAICMRAACQQSAASGVDVQNTPPQKQQDQRRIVTWKPKWPKAQQDHRQRCQ